MTTVPLDDAAVDRRDEAVGGVDGDRGPVPAPRNGSGARVPVAHDRVLPWWRPLARWKAAGRRVLPGVSYPIALYIVWRLASLAVSVYLDIFNLFLALLRLFGYGGSSRD